MTTWGLNSASAGSSKRSRKHWCLLSLCCDQFGCCEGTEDAAEDADGTNCNDPDVEDNADNTDNTVLSTDPVVEEGGNEEGGDTEIGGNGSGAAAGLALNVAVVVAAAAALF